MAKRAYRRARSSDDGSINKKDTMISLRINSALLEKIDAMVKALGTNRTIYLENAAEFVMDRVDFMPNSQPPVFRADEDGPIALFRSEDGTEEIGVQVCRNRVFPMFIIFDMKGDRTPFPPRSLLGIHPLLDEVITDFVSGDKQNYSWDTPEYRDMCARLGLDPDWQRPTFLHEVRDFAGKLVDEVAIGPGWGIADEGIWKCFLMDVIDLLRTDQTPSYFALQSVERNIARYRDREPIISEVREVLEGVKAKRPYTKMVTYIRFLPSAAGGGALTAVHGWDEGCDPDGWSSEWDHVMKGVALAPETNWSDPFRQTCRRRFEQQGVIFLTVPEAIRYMKEEGAYWAWESGYCQSFSSDPKGLEPRQPTRWERLRWLLSKPATPISDRSNARR